MTDDKKIKAINAQIPEELHKKLRIKLLQEEITYKDWLIQQINDFLED